MNTRLQLGDRLTVTIFNEPSLSGVYDITPGGFIDMALIGQIKAVGRTHSELETEIANRYARGHFLQEPK